MYIPHGGVYLYGQERRQRKDGTVRQEGLTDGCVHHSGESGVP